MCAHLFSPVCLRPHWPVSSSCVCWWSGSVHDEQKTSGAEWFLGRLNAAICEKLKLWWLYRGKQSRRCFGASFLGLDKESVSYTEPGWLANALFLLLGVPQHPGFSGSFCSLQAKSEFIKEPDDIGSQVLASEISYCHILTYFSADKKRFSNSYSVYLPPSHLFLVHVHARRLACSFTVGVKVFFDGSLTYITYLKPASSVESRGYW